MQFIIATIKPGDSGPTIANLQDALQLLLDRNVLLPGEEAARRRASTALKQERVDQIFSEVTYKLVGIFQAEQHLEVSGVVDEVTSKLLNHFIEKLSDSNISEPDSDSGTPVPSVEIDPTKSPPRVYGVVLDSNGKPVQNANVQAFDRDLRKKQLLGMAQTNAKGEFNINYQPADFESGDLPSRRTPWLIVEVRENTEGDVLSRQELRQAKSTQYLEFRLAGPVVSECQRIGEAISPLLKGQGKTINEEEKASDLAPSDLTPVDIDFIVLETDLERVAVEGWVASNRILRDAAQILARHDYSNQQLLVQKYGRCFFYGLVRQGLANDLGGVLRESSANWQRSWRAALSANRVPKLNEEDFKLVVASLELLQRLQQLDPAQNPNSDLARVLAHAPLPTTVALDALAIFQKRGLNDADALLKLIDQHPKSETSIRTFVRSVRVYQLVRGDPELFTKLNVRLEGSATDSIAALAAMTAADWISVADKTSISAGQALQLQAWVEVEHPLAALQARFFSGQVKLLEVSGGELEALVKSNGAMVEKILQGRSRVKDEDPTVPALYKTLCNMGRFMRTGVSMELAAELINVDIGTPGKAIRYGREYIYEQIRKKFPIATAHEVADGFFDIVDPLVNGGKGLLVEMDSNRRSPGTKWKNVEEYKLPLPEKVRENLPSLPGFFGDLDECICRPCESMLGQPAYLVDLLNLLSKSRAAFERLKSKRKNIPTLQLSCENAESIIQHIEIVLEILESETASLGSSNTSRVQIESAAYQKLADAVFPLELPFSLPYAQTKAYIAKLGVSRFKLLQLRNGSNPMQLAAEALDASIAQANNPNMDSDWSLLTHKRAGARLWASYGFSIDKGIAIADPASKEQLSNQTVQELLVRASFLIDRTGLSLEDLETALETEFVAGLQGGLRLSNRNQCKTSEMKLPVAGSVLEDILDRLHRFTRLHAKLSSWSIEQLGRAIVACGGIETGSTTDKFRAEVVVKLTHIVRLQESFKLPLDLLFRQPLEETYLRKAMNLSVQQFSLLKTITGLDLRAQPQVFTALEDFCNVAKRITESGLSIEQVAEVLLTRDQLSTFLPTLPPFIKTDDQIENLLKEIQSRLREAVAGQSEQATLVGESQVAAALSQIFNESIARKLINAIRDAGAKPPVPPSNLMRVELLGLLTNSPAKDPGLGEWSPLLSATQAASILDVTSNNNLDADVRFGVLLTGIAESRRKRDFERALIAIVAEQTGLPQGEVVPLLGSRLLLDPLGQGQPLEFASDIFLGVGFWADIPPSTTTTPPTQASVPGVTLAAMPRLHAWMDRLYRLIALSDALKLDAALMQLVERASVSSSTGINWHDLLAAAPPATGGIWSNQHWQALLDLVWLQQLEQLSRPVLTKLWDSLKALSERTAPPTSAEIENALLPLALRVEIPNTQIVAIAAQAIATVTVDTLRNPTELRKAFALLLQARYLRANPTQLDQLANLTDNAQAATTAKALLDLRLSEKSLSEKELNKVMHKIEDPLRQQKRDALVAYLVHRDEGDKWRSANDLYEHFLIDPQMEPCFDTTRIVEAITATQLFIQRIQFGLEEGINPSEDLKRNWTWMRNYRVWEANRKVFLFPENWLFPELRDDKSSSFKQLESALGQGELNQELAVQSFGQFLDDVAQMGQMEVLGMYEDISRNSAGDIEGVGQTDNSILPNRRTLYVVGRTPNPPYAYFWRRCVDFGSHHMEWSPWQRIELDIQDDHVMPFVLRGSLYVAWPLIRNVKESAEDESWEVKLAWSRHDGKGWKKSSISREFWKGKVSAFSDKRSGFAFRCETNFDGTWATVHAYASSSSRDEPIEELRKVPSQWGPETHPGTTDNVDNTYDFLNKIILDSYGASPIPPAVFIADIHPTPSPDDGKLPPEIKRQLFLWAYVKLNFGNTDIHAASDGLLETDDGFQPPAIEAEGERDGPYFSGRRLLFSHPNFSAKKYTTFIGFKYPRKAEARPEWNTRIPDDTYIKNGIIEYIRAFWEDANRYLTDGTLNTKYFNRFYTALFEKSSRRIIRCHAKIRLKIPDSDLISTYPLDGSSVGSYSLEVDSKQFAIALGASHEFPWKLGDQPSIPASACNLTLTLTKISNAVTTPITLESSTEIPEITKGFVTTQHLYFEFDASMHNAIEIGFDLDAMKVLKPVSVFRLSHCDMIERLQPVSPNKELNSPVTSSRPWMNGFREIVSREDPKPTSLLQIITPRNSATSVFSSTKASQFWVVGSATSREEDTPNRGEDLPQSWYYREKGNGCYIDLSGYLASRDIIVYPDAYPDASSRSSEWLQYQRLPSEQKDSFGAEDLPDPVIGNSTEWHKIEDGKKFAFDPLMPYACYNWEVFFHAPLLIADQLSKQHKFEDAERWLRYVFDPTSGGPETDQDRFLKFQVFKDLNLNQQVIDDLTVLAQVAGGFGTASDADKVQKLINRWRDAPFRPFLIARSRYIAFLWRTLFAYLDNLLAWADSQYRRDTRESINEATMLYVLAERILGRRPQLHQGTSKRDSVTFEEVIKKWDDFANYWIDVGTTDGSNRPNAWRLKNSIKQPNPDGMLYFCMPFNEKILDYWNIIEARLSNVRNCRNIDGIKRSLPLMDAKIDPELLIRATAAGLDLSEVISGLYAPPPHYRYSILSARAAELANEAKSLGAAMLSAIEKRDAEHLAQLRSSNEINMLKLVKDVRTKQINEAESNIEALRGSRRTIESRYRQYQRLLGIKDIKVPADDKESVGEVPMLGQVDLTSNRSSWGLIKEESEQYTGLEGANTWSMAANITKIAGSAFNIAAAAVIPNPTAKVTGAHEVLNALGLASSQIGDAFSAVSQGWRTHTEQQGMMAGHIRRRDEWAFQSNQTLKELQQIDKQIIANQIRIDITKKELENHIKQIEQAEAVEEVMRSKFSNEQLYEWMRTQLYGLYSSGYRMALEMARRAERAAARELGVKPLKILRNDYWDSLRDGLLAGERLHQDIKRLEIAYLDQNRREYELTKHISLRRLNPKALVNLRITETENGKKYNQCEFEVPEWLFDLDTPGHYLRRIKSVSVSIPSVVGPFTTVSCKLTLLKSSLRHSSAHQAYQRQSVGDDPNFTDYFGASESIVTSIGSGDSGMFETQLRDERFLPFEGSGVISEWRLELPGEYPQFDYSTISDVILSIRYTAREGGDLLKEAATSAISTTLLTPSSAATTQPLLFSTVLSCRSDFPTEWAHAASKQEELKIPISNKKLLPYWMDAAQLVVRDVLSFNPDQPDLGWTSLSITANKEVNLGRVTNDTDRIVLLSVGKPAAP